jgi:hypothetical protein
MTQTGHPAAIARDFMGYFILQGGAEEDLTQAIWGQALGPHTTAGGHVPRQLRHALNVGRQSSNGS